MSEPQSWGDLVRTTCIPCTPETTPPSVDINILGVGAEVRHSVACSHIDQRFTIDGLPQVSNVEMIYAEHLIRPCGLPLYLETPGLFFYQVAGLASIQLSASSTVRQRHCVARLRAKVVDMVQTFQQLFWVASPIGEVVQLTTDLSCFPLTIRWSLPELPHCTLVSRMLPLFSATECTLLDWKSSSEWCIHEHLLVPWRGMYGIQCVPRLNLHRMPHSDRLPPTSMMTAQVTHDVKQMNVLFRMLCVTSDQQVRRCPMGYSVTDDTFYPLWTEEPHSVCYLEVGRLGHEAPDSCFWRMHAPSDFGVRIDHVAHKVWALCFSVHQELLLELTAIMRELEAVLFGQSIEYN
jgi:hypothetical protein